MIEIIENGKIMIHILVQEDRKTHILLYSSINILFQECTSNYLTQYTLLMLLLKKGILSNVDVF